MASGQWRHATESELFVVDERHSAPSFPSPGHSAAPISAADRPNIVASLLTITNENPPRCRCMRGSRVAHRGSARQPAGRGRGEQLVGQGLQIGCRRWQPAREREVAGAEEDRVEIGDVEDRIHLGERLDIFELHAADGLLPAAEVVGLAGEPPAPGARRPARPSRALRRMHHEVDAPLGLCRVRDLWHEETVGARVEQALRMAAAAVGHPHESGHVHRLRDHDRAVREVERQRAVLHVDDDELEAGHREHLERLEARELHPRAERRRTGSSQPLGNSSHGIGYSSAFSTQPGRSEKSTRGGAKMSIS